MEEFDIKQIPKNVFETFFNFVKDEINEVKVSGEVYSVRELIHGGGFIGLFQDNDKSIFVLLQSLPKEANDFHVDPVIKIKVGPETTGEWAYGRGCKIREVIVTTFREQELRLDHYLSPLAVTAMLIASKMAIKDECLSDEYWEVDKNPERKYSAPPI